MAQRRVVVGTSPVLISQENSKRRSISIVMVPTAIEVGNTGRVHVGKGFTPSATVGAPNQGDILTQGSQISEQEAYPNDPTVFKGQWWAVASQANQVLIVDEMSK
jgi:hypothetical protein